LATLGGRLKDWGKLASLSKDEIKHLTSQQQEHYEIMKQYRSKVGAKVRNRSTNLDPKEIDEPAEKVALRTIQSPSHAQTDLVE
jgi:hypothetical protein